MFLYAVLTIALIGCATDSDTRIRNGSSTQFRTLKEVSLSQALHPESQRYFGELAKLWTAKGLDRVNWCAEKSGESVELLLEINREGVVVEVYGKPWNGKSRCFAAAYRKMQLPKPPELPFYASFVMG